MSLNKIRPFSSIILIFILCGCVTPSNNPHSGFPDNKNVLKVGVSTHSPPLIFEENRKVTGLEADLARQLGIYLNKTVKFVKVDWSKQIDYLEQGKTDIIMSGMTVTAKRSYRIAFSHPYLQSGQIMLTRTEMKNKFNNGAVSLMNTPDVIGIIDGTIGDIFVAKTITRPTIKKFKYSRDAVQALLDKKIDVFVYDAPMLCYYAALHEKDNLSLQLQLMTNENLAWGLRKSDSELQQQVNQFLKKINSNGTLQKTIKRWIPYM